MGEILWEKDPKWIAEIDMAHSENFIIFHVSDYLHPHLQHKHPKPVAQLMQKHFVELMTLEERINRVIHTQAFADVLEWYGMELWEFQSRWTRSPNDKLTAILHEALQAGENELLDKHASIA